MIHCNENENDHINKGINRPRCRIETDAQNVAFFGRTMSPCNKQDLSTMLAQLLKS